MKLKLLTIFMLVGTIVFSQNSSPSDSITPQKGKHNVEYRHSIGTSLFMVLNFFPNSADYYLFNYGYQLSPKDKIFVEFNTWKYDEPKGTYGDSEELYPGFVRAFGVGIGYQRFHWKGLYTSIEATPFITNYYNIDDDKIQDGFQLYLQLIAGYQFEFNKKRFFLEPAYAFKFWPVDTNFPSDFAEIEDGAPKYIFEPSLIFGYKF